VVGVLAGFADAAYFKADDLPGPRGVAHIDVRVAVAAGDVALACGSLHVGNGGDQRGGAVEADFALGDVELVKRMRPARRLSSVCSLVSRVPEEVMAR